MEVQKKSYDYDLAVIGGGSGGISCAKTAANYGKKVLLADFVKPSPLGTSWGLGGTCVNVGCIPKKLMHFAATMGELREDQKAAGWDIGEGKHDWAKMVTTVNTHIKKLNFSYFSELFGLGVDYENCYGSFPDPSDPHVVELTDFEGKKKRITAEHIVVATGGRPRYLNIPGLKENCISSDDLFWQQEAPGKTLVIGGGYVGLECGGFIKGLGHEVDVIVRSVCLRGFDLDMVRKITGYMEKTGVKFLKGTSQAFKKNENGMIQASLMLVNPEGKKEVVVREYKTVLVAAGRVPCTKGFGLEEMGVKMDKGGKIITDNLDRSNIANICAIGDIQSGNLELTPVAIKQGKFLAERLFKNGNRRVNLDYVATAVFTPLEYGCIGVSEERAILLYGKDNLDVYHIHFKPLEWNYLGTHDMTSCYTKAIVTKHDRKVRGIHIVSPNAGEIIQGYTAIVQFGLTFEQMNEMVAIHPTMAEEIVLLSWTKVTNPTAEKENC